MGLKEEEEKLAKLSIGVIYYVDGDEANEFVNVREWAGGGIPEAYLENGWEILTRYAGSWSVGHPYVDYCLRRKRSGA